MILEISENYIDLGNLLESVSIKNKDKNKTFYDSERNIQVYAINTCQNENYMECNRQTKQGVFLVCN